MNTSMKENNVNELSVNEMELISGGSVLAAIGLATACACLVLEGVKFGRKIYRDLTSD